MKRTYVIAHWILTLLIAPFMSQALEFFYGKDPHQVVGLLEVYPITLIFSIAFSIPTFIAYLTCFYFLSKHDTNVILSKFILITVSVLGILITQTIINGSMSQDISIAYSLTSIIIGLILTIRKQKLKTQVNASAT